MKKFFLEFKKFITRGNVLDMAVGVIVGGAFTAIVNSLSNNILKPIINYLLALIFGADSLSEIFTFLKRVEIVNEAGVTEVDLTNSIYIDWGTFIGAIINFLIVAFALFCIVKVINRVKDQQIKLKKTVHGNIAKEDLVAMRKAGIKLKDKEAVDAYFAEKAKKAAEAKAAAEEAARLEREANPTTEDLLKLILTELKSK